MSQELNSPEQILSALQNPAKVPFIVTYEIFASQDRRKLANLDKDIADIEKIEPYRFVFPRERTTTSLLEAEFSKKSHIQERRKQAPSPEKISKSLNTDIKAYDGLKKFFNDRIKEIGLENPLIFYDDKALRIDIGYGPKEFEAIFGKPASCIQQDYGASLEAEKNRLITKATEAFRKPLPQKKIIPLSEIDNLNEVMFLKNCLQNNQGLVIGEKHQDKSPKQFFIDNMPLLKSQGVTTLYMEHLLHECHQELLDAYLVSPIDAPMPKRLELYLKHLDKERELEGSATFTNVVKSAKKNGIRIVAIDSEAIYQLGITKALSDLYNSPIDRFKAMNMGMLERFSQYDNGEKYIAYIGSGHVSTCKEVLGVSDLLGCPNIVIHDLSRGQPQEKIEQNVRYTDLRGITAVFDFLYHRDPETKTKLPHKTVSPESTVTVPERVKDGNYLTEAFLQCSLFWRVFHKENPIPPANSPIVIPRDKIGGNSLRFNR